jgi:outer membrane protein
MGVLNAQDLATGVPVYDPKANFNKVRHAFGWVPWEPAVSAFDHIAQPEIVARPAPLMDHPPSSPPK